MTFILILTIWRDVLALLVNRAAASLVKENRPKGEAEATDLIDKVTQGRQGERTDLLDNIQEVKRIKAPHSNLKTE